MALSIFDDKERPPTGEDLAAALGTTHDLWVELVSIVKARFPPFSSEWGFAYKKAGWGFRLKRKKRVILYMIPREGHFLVAFVFGDKAVKAAHETDVPASILEAIDGAKKYAEGRGVRFEIRTRGDVVNMETLAVVKMEN